MELVKLVLLALAFIAGYGAVLGEASALLCPEAFAEDGASSALLVGPLKMMIEFLIPGIVIGLAIAFAANIGERPALKAFFFVRPLIALTVFNACIATIGAVIGYFATKNGAYEVVGPIARLLPPERHPLLGASWWALLASYVAILMGGIAVASWTWQKRSYFEKMLSKK